MRKRLLIFIIFITILCISSQVYCQDIERTKEIIKELVIKSDYAGLDSLNWERLKLEGLMSDWDISQRNNPLSLAVERYDYKMIKLLLSKGVPQSYWIDQDSCSYLANSIQAGQFDILKKLIDAGLRPEFNDLFRCDLDSDLEILKLILPFINEPLRRYKITEWGEPTGGTTSYLRFLAERENTDMLLSFLLKSNPELINVVYSDYSRARRPVVVSHFTLADIAGERLNKIIPELKLMKAEEIFASTRYQDFEDFFPNSYTSETTVRLRLRVAPNQGAKTITILETGTRLKIFKSDRMTGSEVIDGQTSVWYYVVTSNDERGWVWGGYLK